MRFPQRLERHIAIGAVAAQEEIEISGCRNFGAVPKPPLSGRTRAQAGGQRQDRILRHGGRGSRLLRGRAHRGQRTGTIRQKRARIARPVIGDRDERAAQRSGFR